MRKISPHWLIWIGIVLMLCAPLLLPELRLGGVSLFLFGLSNCALGYLLAYHTRRK